MSRMTIVVGLTYVAENCWLKRVAEGIIQKNGNKDLNECTFIRVLMQKLSVWWLKEFRPYIVKKSILS